MDFQEHKELREFDLDMLEKKFDKKLWFAKEMQKMKLEILKAKDAFNDKRHTQIMTRMEKAFDLFSQKIDKRLT